MRISNFDWDKENIEHIRRHSIHDYEAEEVILSKKSICSKGRDGVYVVFGVTEEGRYLLVVFVTKERNTIRVITARNMIDREKHNYRRRR